MEIILPDDPAPISNFDKLVGTIAGKIFSIVAETYNNQDHLCLLPALTFKIRSFLNKRNSIQELTQEEIQNLAKDLGQATNITLQFLEYNQEKINNLAPKIEAATIYSLRQVLQEK